MGQLFSGLTNTEVKTDPIQSAVNAARASHIDLGDAAHISPAYLARLAMPDRPAANRAVADLSDFASGPKRFYSYIDSTTPQTYDFPGAESQQAASRLATEASQFPGGTVQDQPSFAQLQAGRDEALRQRLADGATSTLQPTGGSSLSGNVTQIQVPQGSPVSGQVKSVLAFNKGRSTSPQVEKPQLIQEPDVPRLTAPGEVTGYTPKPQPVTTSHTPSFREAAIDSAGNIHPMSPALSTKGKILATLLNFARGASDAVAGGALDQNPGRSNFGIGLRAGMLAPQQRQALYQEQQHQNVVNQLEQQQLDQAPILARLRAGLTSSETKKNLAEASSKMKTPGDELAAKQQAALANGLKPDSPAYNQFVYGNQLTPTKAPEEEQNFQAYFKPWLAAKGLQDTPQNQLQARNEFARRKAAPAAEPGTLVPMEDASGKTVLLNNKTGQVSAAPDGVAPKGAHAKSVDEYNKNIAPAKGALDYATNYLANKTYTGPGDEALMEKFFELARPEKGFRMSQPQIDMLRNAQGWFNSLNAKARHAAYGTYFSDEQRPQIVETMKALGAAKMAALGGNAAQAAAGPKVLVFNPKSGKLE